MGADRVVVSMVWTGGSDRVEVRLDSGEAVMQRELRCVGFEGRRTVSLRPSDRDELRALADRVEPADQELVQDDFTAFGGVRVEVWRADASVVIENARGAIEAGPASALAELAHRLINRHLPATALPVERDGVGEA